DLTAPKPDGPNMTKRIGIVVLILLLVAAGWLLVNYWRADLEQKPLTAQARQAAGGSYVTIADGVVHYQLAGPDTGRVVVLVHGFSVPYYIWDPAFDALTAAGFRVLRLDLFGRGYSDRPDVAYNA